MSASGETLLAFDFGTRRIGVAIGNTITGTGRPLAIVPAERNDLKFAGIAALIEEWRPDRLVVGRPLHPDGAEHEGTARAERFARQLEGRFARPVIMVDERYSTVEARRSLAAGEPDDAEAAAIILRQYLHDQQSIA